MIRKGSRLAAAAALVLAASASGLYAEDAPKPIPAIRGSIDLSATQKFFEAQGCPHSAYRAGMKWEWEKNGMLGVGGLSDKPLGFVVVAKGNYPAGENFETSLKNSVYLALPANDGAGKIDALTAYANKHNWNGGPIKVDGDVVSNGFESLRRLDNYVVLAPGDALKVAVDEPFKADYADKSTLANLTIDLAGIRKNAAKPLEKMWKELDRELNRGLSGSPVAAELFLKPIQEKMAAIDTIQGRVWHDDNSLRASATITPYTVKLPETPLPRPVFPEGTLAEVHIAYPDAKSAAWLPAMIESFDINTIPGLKEVPEADKQKIEQGKVMVAKVAKLLLAPDAQSIAVTLNSGAPLVMIVNQYNKPVDFAKEIKDLAGQINALAKDMKEPAPLDISEVDVKGKKMTRVIALDHDQPVGYFEFVQKGNAVYMTLAMEKGELAADLAATPAKGTLKDPLAVALNLGEFVNFLKFTGEHIPPQEEARMHKALDKKIVQLVLTSSKDGKSLVLEASAPLELLKDLGTVYGDDMREEIRNIETRQPWNPEGPGHMAVPVEGPMP